MRIGKGLIALFCLCILLAPRVAWAAEGGKRPPDLRGLLAPGERAWLSAHPVIRVAGDPVWGPIEYRDREGKFVGMTPDYLAWIGEGLGVEFRYGEEASWAECIESLRTGRADMAATLMATPERRSWLLMSRPYISFRYAVFGLPGSPYIERLADLAGSRVLVVAGFGVEELLRRDFPGLELVEKSTAEEAVAALARGGADFFINDIATTSWYVEKLGLTNVKATGDSPYVMELVMGVRKDLAALASILDKALAAMPEAEARAIRREWFSAQPAKPANYDYLFAFAAAAAVVVTAALAWNRILAGRVRERTADLAFANECLIAEIAERKKAEAGLSSALEERGRLLSELNHRVKNNLQLALSLVRLSSSAAEGEGREALDGALGRLEAIARVHETLDPEEALVDLKVDLGLYLENLAADERTLAAEGGLVSLETELERGVRVSMKTAANVGLVVNELLTNARKYAFPEGRRGRISLRARALPEGGAAVEVADDGVGMDPGAAPRVDSLGMSIVRSIVEGFGTSLELKTAPGEGTSWRFVVP